MSAPAIGPAPLPEKSEPGYLPAYVASDAGGKGNIQAFDSKDGPSFSDVLDVLNPLQHIPIVNTLYQHLTGDKEGAVADVAGGALWGGPIGLGAALANLAFQDSTGKSIGDTAYAMITGQSATTAVAQAAPAPSPEEPPVAMAPPRQTVTSSPLPPLAVAAATVSPKLSADAPVRAGDFLVFGGAPSGSAKPMALASNAAPQAAITTTAPQTQQQSSAPTITAPGRQGNFMIFGEGQPAATSLPPIATAADSAATAQAAPNLAPPRELKPLPARNTSLVPRTNLPMPTTGPGALPGGVSQAIRTNTQNAPVSDAWFPGAFNDAMDKYERSKRPDLTPTPGSDQSTQAVAPATGLN